MQVISYLLDDGGWHERSDDVIVWFVVLIRARRSRSSRCSRGSCLVSHLNVSWMRMYVEIAVERIE